MDGGAMRAVVAAAALLSVLPPYRLSAQDSTRIAEAQSVLAQLVETYGVSGAEGPVREAVKRMLPSWAKSETDTAGNLWVRVGQGSPVVVVIAHLDEIGFRVTGIRDDGTLELETRGGFISSLFEAKPALVHADQGDIAGVFLPRDSGFTRHTPPPLRVDVGAGLRAKAMARGVSPGQTVTMPKQYVRLSGTRATGRSFDDRVGATAQLIALRRLDHAALKHQVIFIWSMREEIGLEGAAAAATALGTTPRRVHAIDTFVSADSPIELPNFAVAPIGRGAVARALDNSSITPPAYVDSLVQVARARGVALQVGTTNGGNDGSEFTPYGVVDVPIGWPLRYSHSPAEVIDLKDVVSLADMIGPWPKPGEATSPAVGVGQARHRGARPRAGGARLGGRLDRRHRRGTAHGGSPRDRHRAGDGIPRDDGRAREDAAPQGARRPARPPRPPRRPRRAGRARHHADRPGGRQPLSVPGDGREAGCQLRAGDRADRYRRPLDAPLGREEPSGRARRRRSGRLSQSRRRDQGHGPGRKPRVAEGARCQSLRPHSRLRRRDPRLSGPGCTRLARANHARARAPPGAALRGEPAPGRGVVCDPGARHPGSGTALRKGAVLQ